MIAALIFLVLIGIFKKCGNTFFLYFKELFRKKTFLPRKYSFQCQQSKEKLSVCVTRDKHLHAKSLLGDVDPPATYGLYIKKQKGGPARIEMDARAKGKKFKKIVKYIGKCIVPYRTKIYTTNESPEWKNSISAEFIIQKHILPCVKTMNPHLFFVRGKVGCGKSTLIMDLASKVTSNNITNTSVGNIAAIVVNVRFLLHKMYRFDEEFNTVIVQPNFSRDILDGVKKEVVRLLWETKIHGIDKDMDYSSAIDACYRVHVSPLIILDELDILYADFCKRIVSNINGQDRKCIEMYKQVFGDICSLHNEVPLPIRNSFANTIFMVVARSSTKMLMEEVLGTGLVNDICHIKIDEAESDKINDIIRRQLIVLSKTSEGKSNRNLQYLIDQYLNNKIDYSKNIAVSVHGVRHLMNAIAKINEIDPKNFELLKLVAGNPGLLRLYQYIDGNPDYSQAQEGISNIYLINRDAPKKCNEVGGFGHHSGFDEWLLQDHLQTYWLKYFICRYLVKKAIRQENDNTDIVPQPFMDVVSVFHCENSNDKKQFEMPIVKLALLHASKVDHGRLIKFGYREGYGNTVIPSNRLLEMIKSNLFWDFGYLMVVVEDKWLEFPLDLYSELKRDNDKTVYDFVTKFHVSTDLEKIDFIKHKVTQSLTFFLVLKEALNYEKERYESVFRRLEEAGVNTNIVYDFEKHLNRSIFEFTRNYINPCAVDEISMHVDEFQSKRRGLTKRIRKSFSAYHRKPSIRSIDSMMKMYYSHGLEGPASNKQKE